MRVLIVCVLTAVFLGSSVASGVTYEDPNDVQGPLDIHRSSFVTLKDPARLRFTMETYEGWTRSRCRRALRADRACTVLFWLDTRGTNGLDYWLWWRIGDCAVMIPYTETVVATGAASKTRRSVTCTIRRGAVDAENDVRWYVTTAWEENRYLLDTAPDSGWYG